MSWEAFYLICFGVGLVLTLLSFAGGLHHPHFAAHGVLRGAAGHPAHPLRLAAGRAAKAGLSPVNGFTVTAFLCWFGGTGYLLARYGAFGMLVILALAILGGLAGGALIFLFLARLLLPHDRALTAEETEMTGVLGRVSGAIREQGTGEILFSQNGTRRFSPARSEDGQPIARDVEVVVLRYEGGIAYVRRWDEISGSEPLSSAETKP
ncbi:MAG TPA: NfeD family protein [Acidobacteriaceae bacterium]|nr:NfeD family protein [Acidobacteriaceae bacterium]